MGGECPSLLKERPLVSVRAEKTVLLKQVLALPSRVRNSGLEKEETAVVGKLAANKEKNVSPIRSDKKGCRRGCWAQPLPPTTKHTIQEQQQSKSLRNFSKFPEF